MRDLKRLEELVRLKDRTGEKREDDPIDENSDNMLSFHLTRSKARECTRPSTGELRMTWVDGSNLEYFDGGYSHVGGDGMIFDNRNEMEGATKIRQKSCKFHPSVCDRCGFCAVGWSVRIIGTSVLGGGFIS